MHKKITDLWPNLLRPIPRSTNQVLNNPAPSQNVIQSDDNDERLSTNNDHVVMDQVNEEKLEQINEDFKNLYWS